jgi:ABC-type dipeptide/oligopeptide/nickel transport system permease subunit
MTSISGAETVTAVAFPDEARRGRSTVKGALRLERRQPIATFFAFLLLGVIFLGIAAPVVSPHEPRALVDARLLSPSATYPLGTDELGRDVLSRVIHGARVSMIVGFSAVILTVAVGGGLGIISGYFFGWVDTTIQRLMDALMAFPALILAIALVAVLGRSTLNVVLAISIVMVPITQRVVRSAVLVEMTQPYIEAARVVGASQIRIMLRHLLPNVFVPIVIVGSSSLGAAILTEAALSFLGLGVQPPTPSWGNMINASSRLFLFKAPWIAVFPGLAIMLVVMAFNFIGDAIRDELDPRLRGDR